ncbi:MAG: HIT family protein, partial [Burkholderiaceae bacterium]|nr:HIT family protein [Burkholderiaceae bacterium]
MEECIFCQVPKDEIVAESDLCLAFYDRYPVSPGHMLIIPKRHVASYFELTADEINAMQTML